MFRNLFFLCLLLMLIACGEDDGACQSLKCLPDPPVSAAVPNNGQSIMTTQGGIAGLIVYAAGNTYRAYDLQDPDKCTNEVNDVLTLSKDKLYLESNSGEKFFLIDGSPTQGISCRRLIEYRAEAYLQTILISNR